MNYIDDTIQPMDKKVTCLQKQIDYLDHAKADCINIRGCNPNGYITFAIDCDGNETITGIRNLANSIDGYTTVESLLTDLAGRGGGDLATKIKVHATNAAGAIPIVPACDSTYQEVCFSPILTADNAGLTVDGKLITCGDIDTNGHTVCGADGTFTGTVGANAVNAASVTSTGNVSGATASFTNSVTTPLVCNGNALVLCGDGNPLSIDGVGACLAHGCFCVPTLHSCTSCVTGTANIQAANICTACIDTATINNLQLGYMSYDSTNDNLRIGNNSTVTGTRNYIISGNDVTACGCTTFINSIATSDAVSANSVFINSYAGDNVGGIYINGSADRMNCGTVSAWTEIGIGSIKAASVYGREDSLNCDYACAILNIFDLPLGGGENCLYSFPFMGYIYKSANPYIQCKATYRIEYCFNGSGDKIARIVAQDGCSYEFRSNCTSVVNGPYRISGMIYGR